MSLRDDLKAYVDGELSSERAAEVSAALSADPTLAAEADELRRLSTEIQAFTEVPAPVGLERALRAVRPRLPWWSPLGRTGQLAWGATATAAVLVAVMLYLPKSNGLSMDAARYETAAMKSPTAAKPAEVERSAASIPPSKLSQPAPGTFAGRAEEEAAPAATAADTASDGLEEAKAKADPGTSPKHDGRSQSQDLRLSLKVADQEQAEAEVVAMAGPLGGSAQVDKDRIVLTVPQERTDEAMKGLRKIGKVETVEGQHDRNRAGMKNEAVGPAVTNIEANIEATPRPKQPVGSDEPGPSPVFWALLGLIGLAGAGVLWSLRRRV
ncbi:MAG: hypothetical protein K1X67_22430 [Fimbriimonadaceae bacterium]|nr:hypothetical protein [Fimbriimonadaceae bacterium]